MRALKELPEIETKIESGILTLANIAQAQYLFNQERKEHRPFTRDEKLQMLSRLENQSKRAAEKIVIQEKQNRLPFPGNKLCVKDIAAIKEVKLRVSEEFEKKLNKLKNLLAHKLPNANTEELLLEAMSLAIEKLDPAQKPPRKNPSIKVQIWKKSQGKCEICKSEYALQIDHRTPKAHGGSNKKENLRLLCRSCNQRQAIEKIGKQTMFKYF